MLFFKCSGAHLHLPVLTPSFPTPRSSVLDKNRFFIATTTVNAVAVMRHIDFALQVIWPGLKAHACSITEGWAQIAVAGPTSRALLQDLLQAIDLSNESFPFMGALAVEWKGIPIRLFRLSFSGHRAYAIAAQPDPGEALVRARSGPARTEVDPPAGLQY